MFKPQLLISVMALATTVVLQGASLAQAASLTLDAFDEPTAGSFISTDPLTGLPSTTTDTGLSGLFNERDRVAITTAGTVTSSSSIGGLDFISGSGLGSGQQYLLIYDGVTDSTAQTGIYGTFGSLGGVDLINGNNSTLRFNFVGALTEANSNVDIRAISDGGVNDVTLNSAFTPVDGTSTYDVEFSSFTNVNFANLDALIIQYDDLEGANFSVDSIQAVPEPTTILGTLLTLCMGVLYRKRLSA